MLHNRQALGRDSHEHFSLASASSKRRRAPPPLEEGDSFEIVLQLYRNINRNYRGKKEVWKFVTGCEGLEAGKVRNG